MDIYRFDPKTGRTIETFGSHFTLNAIGHFKESSHVILMSFFPGDSVGRHEAIVPQLFFVVEGSGWATGATGDEQPIKAYEAAYWTKGEVHGAGTSSGMKALVIESETLDSNKFMAVKKED